MTIVVSARPGLEVTILRASPNPVSSQTTLSAELNRSGEPLDWTSGIYDLTGRLVYQQTGQCTDCEATLAVGTWNGLTKTGASLANGLYIVRCQVRSAIDGTVANSTCRLVLAK
ncbi:MAG: T9SS type A sorting domain-containing protein [Cytophagaceae bacterium]|nr:MAG: T9SS type A sorting domain-containing protein [Cytophagaceae bacterium]